MIDPPELRTQRLLLRAIRADDAADLHPMLADEHVMRYWSSAPHRSLAETADYVAANADMGGCWAITRGAGAIGWVILIERRDGVAEIGYILNLAHWGQGIAREALGAVIAHGFSSLNLRRICADVDPDNAPSLALLERMGFRREGYLRAEWETHIGVRDSVILGLLRDEWAAAPAAPVVQSA